jgi:hypothetical protein
MPPHDGVRVHDDERCAPTSPCAREADPKQAIARANLRPLAGARQRRQLLTQRQILQCDGTVSAAEQAEQPKDHDQRRRHAVSCRAFTS